jgi:hypothetical protein
MSYKPEVTIGNEWLVTGLAFATEQEARDYVADLARIAQAVPADAVAGTRYPPAVLAHMDSEKMES